MNTQISNNDGAQIGASLLPRICSAKSVKSWLKRFWLCGVMQSHDWTCAAEQGIPATPKQLADGIAGFWSYATMYCARCGKVSELSKRRQQ